MLSSPRRSRKRSRTSSSSCALNARRRRGRPLSDRFVVVAHRPDAETSIADVASELLDRAGVLGAVPTDVDALIAASRLSHVVDPEPFRGRFLKTLSSEAARVFDTAWEKIRGIADLRTRAIYVPKTGNRRRSVFPKAHELGHQVLPWQQFAGAFWDDRRSLSPEAIAVFDQEANFFAAEVIFQGERFRHRARSYQPSWDAVFSLADEYGASRHATLWRYVEEQDEAFAAALYWPSPYRIGVDGRRVFRLGRLIGSPSFARRFADLALPSELTSDHPWVAARNLGQVVTEQMFLEVGGVATRFEWQAWWNTYTLFVLLRRKPALNLVARLVGP